MTCSASRRRRMGGRGRVSPCVADRQPNQEPRADGRERQPAFLGLDPHPADNRVDVRGAPVGAKSIHLGGVLVAPTTGSAEKVEAGEDELEVIADAVDRDPTHSLVIPFQWTAIAVDAIVLAVTLFEDAVVHRSFMDLR